MLRISFCFWSETLMILVMLGPHSENHTCECGRIPRRTQRRFRPGWFRAQAVQELSQARKLLYDVGGANEGVNNNRVFPDEFALVVQPTPFHRWHGCEHPV